MKAKKVKYKVGQLVYSYQNKTKKYPIIHIYKSENPRYDHKYKLQLPDGSSNWIDESGIYLTKKKITGWRKGGTFMREEYENVIKNKKNVRVKRAKKGSVNRKPGTFKNFTTLSGVNKIKVGDLVKVKKFGWIMRVDNIKGDLLFLENSKKGFDLSGKYGNPGSYYINEIQKIDNINGTKSNYHKDTKSHNVNIRVIGGLKLKYKIFQGYDWYKGKYIYQVVGINNDFVGEWHTLKRDAQKELKYLRKKVVGGIYKSHG